MVYKRTKRGGAPAGMARNGGANDRAGFKNTSKIGEATAKRMQDKLGKLKKGGKDDDDEIKSNESEGYGDRDLDNPKNAKKQELLNDPFFEVDHADRGLETVEEKRLRMTK
jgi:hypothetical protein